jgi:hypothetical protein
MIGLDTLHSQVLSGDQIDQMSEHQLEQIANSVSVFYRVTPKHKLCIIKVKTLTNKIEHTYFDCFNVADFVLCVAGTPEGWCDSRNDGGRSQRWSGPEKG